jgi:N-acetylglutamate synthase-like GNAT family acetyltransferase
VARTLPQPYGEYLGANPAGAANICLKGYKQELEGLPGPYFVLLLAEVDGVAAGCVALRWVAGDELGCEMKRLSVDGTFRGFGLGDGWRRKLLPGRSGWD